MVCFVQRQRSAHQGLRLSHDRGEAALAEAHWQPRSFSECETHELQRDAAELLRRRDAARRIRRRRLAAGRRAWADAKLSRAADFLPSLGPRSDFAIANLLRLVFSGSEKHLTLYNFAPERDT